MKFHMVCGKGIVSKLIMFFSAGYYSHVAIELDGFVFESEWYCGVIKTPVDQWGGSAVKETLETRLMDPKRDEILSWLNKQVGKKYDWLGVLSFVFGFLKPRMGYFYCSELAAICYYKSINYHAEVQSQKISPQMFYYITRPYLKLRIWDK